MGHHNDAYCTFVSAMDDTHRRAAHAALRHERLALQQGPAGADRYEPLPTPARGWTPRLVPAMTAVTAVMAVVATALVTVAGLIQDRMA